MDPAAVIGADQVVRKPLAQRIGSVARDPVGRRPLHQPLTSEGNIHDHRVAELTQHSQPDSRSRPLTSSPADPKSHARPLPGKARDSSVLVHRVSRRPPGADQAYQVWVISDGTPRSVGVLAVGSTGATDLVSGIRGAQLIGVTREPQAAPGPHRAPRRPGLADLTPDLRRHPCAPTLVRATSVPWVLVPGFTAHAQ